MAKACLTCQGRGFNYHLRSWFTRDGYRKIRCGLCAGSGERRSDLRPEQPFARLQKRAVENVRLWGALKQIQEV